MRSIVLEEDATIQGVLSIMCACVTPQRISDTEIFSSNNVWYPRMGGLENVSTGQCSPVSRNFECAIEKNVKSLGHQPHGLDISLREFLGRLAAIGVAPAATEGDPFWLFNVSSEDNQAYFVARLYPFEDFVVYVYAREIDQTVLANITAVDESLSRLLLA